MPRARRRNVLELVKNPTCTYERITDIPYRIESPEHSPDTIARLIFTAARGCANQRQSGDEFTLAVEIPGSEKEFEQIRRYLNLAAGRKAAVRLVNGKLYQVDENLLVGRLTFQTR